MPQEFATVDQYIASFPPDVRERLNEIREVIRAAAPAASEKISWGMPTFVLNGNLVHFAAHKNHIGFYPGADGAEKFRELSDRYASSKGGVRLPLDEPLPREIITAVVAFRVAEQEAKAPRER